MLHGQVRLVTPSELVACSETAPSGMPGSDTSGTHRGRFLRDKIQRMGGVPERRESISAVPRRASEEEHFQAVLDSPCLQKAPTVRSLFFYLWRHRGEPISEYAIATEALGRRPDFDPKADATVRVHISRLRQKLKEYYETEGQNCPLRLSLPLGGHQLEVHSLDAGEPAPTPPEEATPEIVYLRERKAADWTRIGLVALCVVLAAACLAQYVSNRRLTSSEKPKAPLPPFWQAFFANGKATNLYLPSPVFFEWNSTNLKIRDPEVNEFADFDNSAELKLFTKQWGSPKLLQNYTVTSDTLAALKLIQYFEHRGITLGFGGTADLSLESIATKNVILLGTPGITSRHVKSLMKKTNFCYAGINGATVFNRKPRPGESARYDEVIESDRRRTSLGVISLLPGKASGTLLLSLTGRFTSPLASFLTSSESMEQFEGIWRKEGAPPHFELLVRVEVDGDTVLKSWPLAIRALQLTY